MSSSLVGQCRDVLNSLGYTARVTLLWVTVHKNIETNEWIVGHKNIDTNEQTDGLAGRSSALGSPVVKHARTT